MFADLGKDIQFFHKLIFPNRHPTLYSLTRVLFGSRGLLLLALYRMSYSSARWHPVRQTGQLLKVAVRLIIYFGKYLSLVMTKSDIFGVCLIEPGVYLANKGHLILGARIIGAGTIIHDRVTIGMDLFNSDVPEIGRNVWIGPCSIIFGKIKVGDGVTVMPHTVLTKSVPAGTVVQGNPARIIRHDFDAAALRLSLSTKFNYMPSETKFGEKP